MAIQKFGEAEIESIHAFEGKHNLRLPQDYIDFLLKYNGGIVEKDQSCELYVEILHSAIHVDVLYGIDTAHKNANIETWMELFKNDMLDGTVIIGDSIEHGFLVLVCEGEDAGLCYWDHTYEFSSSDEETNMYYITETFSRIIGVLL